MLMKYQQIDLAFNTSHRHLFLRHCLWLFKTVHINFKNHQFWVNWIFMVFSQGYSDRSMQDKFNGYIFLSVSILNMLEDKYNIIRLIPQGTVDNNLGPDPLADPKALDPNYCRQPTL